MSSFITLIVGMIGAGLLAYAIAASLAGRRLEQAKTEAFQRGIRLGEKNARWHNRSFIRYEKYERLTPEQVMPGPFVEEHNR